MKNILFTLALLVSFPKESALQKSFENNHSDCENLVSFGDINICLPNLPLMKECYSEPLIKMIADLFKGSKNEEIIGFYLSETDYKQAYENYLDDGTKDPYIKIFSYEDVKGVKADNEILNYMRVQSESLYEALEDYKTIERLEEKFDVSFAKPILLENYQITPNSYSVVVLMSFSNEVKNYVQVGIMNYILIKERVIAVAYYEEYSGMDQVSEIKSKNDFFILSLNSMN